MSDISLILVFISLENEMSYVYIFLDEHLQKKRLPLSGKDLLRQFNNVKTFVMFIGYPRSGHSLIGSLLDAHPEIVIPHEYDIVANWKWLTYSDTAFSKNVTKYRLFYDLYSLSEKQALFRLRSPKRSPRSYCYHVPGTWQGTYHKTIKVSRLNSWTVA